MLASTVQFSSNGRPADTRHAYPSQPRPPPAPEGTTRNPNPRPGRFTPAHDPYPSRPPTPTRRQDGRLPQDPTVCLRTRPATTHQLSPAGPKTIRPEGRATRRPRSVYSPAGTNRTSPSSQCSTHEQPPDAQTAPQMVSLTPSSQRPPPGQPRQTDPESIRGGIRCSLERR
jgi:hypothetical protein